MHWLFNGKPFEEILIGKNKGFVYKITNKMNGKAYIGRKYFTAMKSYQKDKKKYRTRVESNWKIYTGSNEQLNEDIKNNGIENFLFEILALGLTEGVVNFLEVEYQFKYEVLRSDNWYNSNINGKWYSDLISTYSEKTLLCESVVNMDQIDNH